jgi:hypothetical protein
MNTKALALSAAFSLTALGGYAATTQSGLGLASEAMDDAISSLNTLPPGNHYGGGYWKAKLGPGVIAVSGSVLVVPDSDEKKMQVQECAYNMKTYHLFGKKIGSTRGELTHCVTVF